MPFGKDKDFYQFSFYERGLIPRLNTVAEIGPGDSLGIGLTALLSGANNYFALDIAKTAYNYCNQDIFEELIILFKQRAPILNEEEEPKMLPQLKSYKFPDYIFSDEKLNQLLEGGRLNAIHGALIRLEKGRRAAVSNDSRIINIRYFAPWNEHDVIENDSVDVMLAVAVMEHVEDINKVYAAAASWLKKVGFLLIVLILNLTAQPIYEMDIGRILTLFGR